MHAYWHRMPPRAPRSHSLAKSQKVKIQQGDWPYRLYEDPAHFLPEEAKPSYLKHCQQPVLTSPHKHWDSLTMTENLPDFGLSHDSAGFLFLSPSSLDRARGVTGITQECLCHGLVSWGTVVLELAHVAMVGLDAHALHTLRGRGCRAFIHDQLPSSLDIRRQGFMEQVDVVAAHDLDEETVDVLQGLVVGSKGSNEVW